MTREGFKGQCLPQMILGGGEGCSRDRKEIRGLPDGPEQTRFGGLSSRITAIGVLFLEWRVRITTLIMNKDDEVKAE